RIFVTALLVYVAFWNPWLQFSSTDNFVDGAVSLVDTGRWELVHWRLYGGKDDAAARAGRVVPGVPLGMAWVMAPAGAAAPLAGAVGAGRRRRAAPGGGGHGGRRRGAPHALSRAAAVAAGAHRPRPRRPARGGGVRAGRRAPGARARHL